ncbi:MAG TPA: undecaprenyl-diphosphate phosphatase [Candidatus Anaerofilum excrementigallinarum]|nr:undecaprenyl-diphosphate phosphatase [Candidatus Anaerofilum excrementigallinarum]
MEWTQTLLELIKAVFYGLVEGITEWLPVSSTGHMILFEEFVHFSQSKEFMEMFRVVIQLGAILAVVVLFWDKIWPFTADKSKHYIKKESWVLWFHILVATLPALVLGLLLDDWLDAHFYNFITVAVMLIVYGVLFIAVEKNRKGKRPRVRSLDKLSYRDAFIIGLWQVLAMIPGTSRSGATIVGGLLLGTTRSVAAEFTFFLAIPVMAGASLLKLLKFGFAFTGTELAVLAVGMVVAFVVSLVAIRFLMGYVKRHSFRIFGIYRILLGVVLLVYYFVFRQPA